MKLNVFRLCSKIVFDDTFGKIKSDALVNIVFYCPTVYAVTRTGLSMYPFQLKFQNLSIRALTKF